MLAQRLRRVRGWILLPQCLGRSSVVPRNVIENSKYNLDIRVVAAVSCGETHTLALTADGRLIAWGDNAYGQLGNVTDRTSSSPFVVPLPLKDGETPTEVHAGAFHSLIVTSTGRLLVFGDNSFGQLGRGRGGFMHSFLSKGRGRERDERVGNACIV